PSDLSIPKAPVGTGPWRRRNDEVPAAAQDRTCRPPGSSTRTPVTGAGCPAKCPPAIILRLNGRNCCLAACSPLPPTGTSRDELRCRGSATGRSRDCLAGGGDAADRAGLPLVWLEGGRGGAGGRDRGAAGWLDRRPDRFGGWHHRRGSGDDAPAG